MTAPAEDYGEFGAEGQQFGALPQTLLGPGEEGARHARTAWAWTRDIAAAAPGDRGFYPEEKLSYPGAPREPQTIALLR